MLYLCDRPFSFYKIDFLSKNDESTFNTSNIKTIDFITDECDKEYIFIRNK